MGSVAETSTLYIVRHAECMNNTTRILLPPDEDILTETGKEQAALLGEHLSDEKFTGASCSDYSRTVETAQIILSKSKHSSGIELKKDERIRERNMGIFEGGHVKGIFVKIMEHLKDGREIPELELPESELPEEMFAKVEAFLSDIFKTVDESDSPQTLLAVTHGFFVLYLVHYLKRSTEKFTLKNNTGIMLKVIPNTGFLKIAIEKQPKPGQPRTLQVLAEHETVHLKSMQRNDVLHTYSQTAPEAKPFSGCVHQ